MKKEKEIIHAESLARMSGAGQQQLLAYRLMDCYRDLAGKRDFECALERARNFVPGDGDPVFIKVLREKPGLRLVMLGLHRDRAFPVHDHAGRVATQMLLSGCMRIRHYREQGQCSRGMIRLECASDRKLYTGGFDYVDQEHAIHGLQSVTRNAVLLNLQLGDGEEGDRHWYFPATACQEGKPLWYRIRRKESREVNAS